MSNEGFVKTQQPCPCGDGSDNTGINANGSAKCFNCGKFFPDYEEALGNKGAAVEYAPAEPKFTETFSEVSEIPDRKLTLDTCKKYGIKVVKNSFGDVVQHIYPYENSFGDEVAVKNRYCAGGKKDFSSTGNLKEAVLFGQNIFKKGGKYITITEGELDAAAVHQMFGSKHWAAAVSVKNAATALNDIKSNLEYLESFDNIVLCLDNDEAGKKAVDKIVKVLKPGKAKIMTLPEGYKDASDMLKANKSAEFVQAFWDAKTYTPSGILNLTNLKQEFFSEEQVQSVAFPWDGLNKAVYGMRRGELLTITGGSGLGKSAVTREIEHHLLTNSRDRVGVVALEENWKRTAMGIVSIEENKRLFIKEIRDQYSEEKIMQSYNRLFEGENADRFFIHAHLGIQDIDDIFNKLRFLILGCDCQWIVLDHLHMLVASYDGGDERQTIDDIMIRLRSLVEETGCGMILVSHLKRANSDKGHEQGIEVALAHLRGSQSIAQVSDSVIALERNQQATDLREANMSCLRVLKDRYSGFTGVGCHLNYDRETGRLTEVDKDLDEFTLYDTIPENKYGF